MPDVTLSGRVPAGTPAGEHDATIIIGDVMTPKRFSLADLPRCDVPWDGSVSLRREDIYGNDSR